MKERGEERRRSKRHVNTLRELRRDEIKDRSRDMCVTFINSHAGIEDAEEVLSERFQSANGRSSAYATCIFPSR